MKRLSYYDSKFEKDHLDALLRADAWDEAKAPAHKLYQTEPYYFNIQRDMDRFARCRQLLNLGLLCEHDESRSATLFGQQECMTKALRVYNHG